MIRRRVRDVFARAQSDATGMYGAVWRKIKVLDNRSASEVGTSEKTIGPMAEIQVVEEEEGTYQCFIGGSGRHVSHV